MILIDFTEIPAEGDRWTLFAQDFMKHLGFQVERPSYRDASNMFDFCAVEQLQGRFNYHPFRWLVSCRHKAATRTAVRESEETDILERLLRCKADGFLGFYSTPVSSALAQSLSEMKGNMLIKDYRFFDPKYLETFLVTPAFGRIVSRYFPNYAQTHHSIVLIGEEYLPIRCEHCEKDLLATLFSDDQKGVVVRLRRRKTSQEDMDVIHDVYFACKGACDEQLQAKHCNGTFLSAAGWTDLSDLVIPPIFLERVLSLLNQIGHDEMVFTRQALEKEEYLLRALSQRTLRESTEGERQQAKKLMFNG